MRKKRKLFGILLVITALIIMQLPKSEADAATSASDFKMKGTTLVKYVGLEKNVSIPRGVEEIAEDAFDNNDSIEKVIIPDTVKRIDAYAFWGCDNLNTVVLGKGLIEVGDFVFANCKGLETMTIPDNVRSIGIQAFVDCVNMTDITIPPEVTNIHESAFDGCYRLVIHCETGSFADKYAKEFYEKQLEMPEYEDVDQYTPDSDDDTGSGDTDHGTGSENGEYVTGNLLGSTSVVANQAVVFIDNTSPVVQSGAISGNQNIVQIPLPEGNGTSDVKFTIVDGRIVADQAYYKNKELKDVILPMGIKEIGQFSYARSSITGIRIPQGVKTIGYGAFYHCDSLKEVELPSGIVTIEPKAFVYTGWLEDFYKGNEVFCISGGALVAYNEKNASNPAKIVIPDGVTVIAGEVFKDNTRIESIVIPGSLEVIGEGAFEGCSSLEAIEWPEQKKCRVREVKDRAFLGSAIKEISVPASVEKMGLGVFEDGTRIHYVGKEPVEVHELSAERLSNEGYRFLGDEPSGKPGVIVTDTNGEPITTEWEAHLEGANRPYNLIVSETADKETQTERFRTAFARIGRELPMLTICDITLTDSSGIPITKLGKQLLTITMPVGNHFAGEQVTVVTLDRNGQLEELKSQRIRKDGKDYVRFTTTHLSLFAMYGEGVKLSQEDVVEEVTVNMEQSAAPGAKVSQSVWAGKSIYQWIVGGVLFLAGIICILRKGKG